MVRRSVDIISKLDWLTVLLVLAIMICGWFSICGASADIDNPDLFSLSTRPGKQIVWILCSLSAGAILLSVTQKFLNTYAYIIYIALIALLVVTVIVAPDTKGSRSWLVLGPVSMQPAEFAKFATALALAKYVDRFEFRADRMKDSLLASAFFLLPMVLIVAQKETGSALVYIAFFLVLFREGMTGNILLIGFSAIVFFILGVKYAEVPFGGQPFDVGTWLVLAIVNLITAVIAGRINRNRKAGLTVLAISTGGMLVGLSVSLTVIPFKVTWLQVFLAVISCIYLAFNAIKNLARKYWLVIAFCLCSIAYLFSVDYVFNDILADHQRTRINVILGLEEDIHGAGYNVHQSMIAIGSGGFSGKGFMKGTQTKLKYVPEQDTDFIFCTVGEEKGFLGASFVLLLYMALLLRLIWLAERQPSVFGRVYGYSVACILLFHVFINVGMVLGITPVIGIPLPFFSYGGSSLLGFMLLISVFLRIDCERGNSY